MLFPSLDSGFNVMADRISFTILLWLLLNVISKNWISKANLFGFDIKSGIWDRSTFISWHFQLNLLSNLNIFLHQRCLSDYFGLISGYESWQMLCLLILIFICIYNLYVERNLPGIPILSERTICCCVWHWSKKLKKVQYSRNFSILYT